MKLNCYCKNIMGTGASSASSRSPSPEMAITQRNHKYSTSDSGRKDSLGLTKWKGHNVISNEVAPILITKGCFEEYQCTMLAEKQTVTKGRIQEGLPEHPLIQVGIYWLCQKKLYNLVLNIKNYWRIIYLSNFTVWKVCFFSCK